MGGHRPSRRGIRWKQVGLGRLGRPRSRMRHRALGAAAVRWGLDLVLEVRHALRVHGRSPAPPRVGGGPGATSATMTVSARYSWSAWGTWRRRWPCTTKAAPHEAAKAAQAARTVASYSSRAHGPHGVRQHPAQRGLRDRARRLEPARAHAPGAPAMRSSGGTGLLRGLLLRGFDPGPVDYRFRHNNTKMYSCAL